MIVCGSDSSYWRSHSSNEESSSCCAKTVSSASRGCGAKFPGLVLYRRITNIVAFVFVSILPVLDGGAFVASGGVMISFWMRA
jgi:hypothetical protein